MEDYLKKHPVSKLVFKDNLGGGHNSEVIFGPQLRQKQEFVKKLKSSKSVIVTQPYLNSMQETYTLPASEGYEKRKLKELLRIYVQPKKGTWTAQFCAGIGPNVSFANYSVPVYFGKHL